MGATMNTSIFDDDMNDSLDDLLRPGTNAESLRKPVTPPASYQAPETYFEKCRKCAGTGMTRWGTCFRCKGKKGKTFKTSPESRAANRQQSRQREAQKSADKVEAFKAEHPDVWQWMDGSEYPFAVDLRDGLMKYGSLTENQLTAARRAIAKLAVARTAAAERKANAPTIQIDRVAEAFANALAAGLKKVKLQLDTFKFKPAHAAGKNPGAIYVTESGQYLGKIVGGKFIRVRECSTETEARVLAAAADPAAAARAFGLRTGRCSCCGRELTDPESIADGIGPICAGHYGF